MPVMEIGLWDWHNVEDPFKENLKIMEFVFEQILRKSFQYIESMIQLHHEALHSDPYVWMEVFVTMGARDDWFNNTEETGGPYHFLKTFLVWYKDDLSPEEKVRATDLKKKINKHVSLLKNMWEELFDEITDSWEELYPPKVLE